MNIFSMYMNFISALIMCLSGALTLDIGKYPLVGVISILAGLCFFTAGLLIHLDRKKNTDA